MLVIVCQDGVARVGDGGGVTRYERLDQIAGAGSAIAYLDMPLDQACAALASIGMPWWRRMINKARGISRDN